MSETAEITQIGPYRVLAQLGRGGMGTVYRAIHETLERNVALKVLPADLAANKEFISRFLREAKAAAALRHPHIVEVYDAGFESGKYFIAMELIEGCSLQDYLKEKPCLDEAEGLRLLREAAEGLAAAHAKGLVHRDIKPDNILLMDKRTVRIVDFGLVRDATSETKLTVTGALMGTPSYISPEQAGGEAADERSDLYSLGCTFYRALSGHPVFVSESTLNLVFKHRFEIPPDPRKHNPHLSENAAHLLLWMLAKKAADRPASAKEVSAAVERIGLGGTIPAPNWLKPPPPGALDKTVRMNAPAPEAVPLPGYVRWMPLGAAAGAVLLAGLLWLALSGAEREPEPGEEAPPATRTPAEALPSEAQQLPEPREASAPGGALGAEEQEEFEEFMTVGQWALQKGRYAQARANFLLALRLKPGHPPAEEGLRQANAALGK